MTGKSWFFRGEQTESVEAEMNWFHGFEGHHRSLVKAITWRVTGSIDTFVISFILTGRLTLAGSIALTELLTKIVLYYFHERVWAVVRWGRAKDDAIK